VKVTIEFQVSSEGVRNDHHEDADAILDFYPLLNHTGAQIRQVVEKMTVSSENAP